VIDTVGAPAICSGFAFP